MLSNVWPPATVAPCALAWQRLAIASAVVTNTPHVIPPLLSRARCSPDSLAVPGNPGKTLKELWELEGHRGLTTRDALRHEMFQMVR